MNNLRIFTMVLLLLMVFALVVGCTPTQPPEDSVTYSGDYVLQKAMIDGNDVTSSFLNYNLSFKNGESLVVNVNYKGNFERRMSTYVGTKTSVTESYNGKTYVYTVGEGTLTTTYQSADGEITVTLVTKNQQSQVQSVDFASVLFGEDVSASKKFNYCPAILTEVVDGKETMNIWYCTNKDDGIIMDHIGYRTGVKQDDGKWLFSDEKIVLAPTDGTWDARHTCDPAVVKGEFKLKGETYNYLMAYLGCTTEDYQKNETGIAVAKQVGGPWVKVDNVNPIVPWYDDGNVDTEQQKYENWQGTSRIYWGTGMPSLLSVDGKGKVVMFYQSTLRGTGIRLLDLSNLDSPVLEYTVSLSSAGILNSVNSSCNIGIPDFAYDKATGRLYVVSVTNEKNPPDVSKTLVNSHSMVAYLDGLSDMQAVVTALKTGGYRWNMVGYVGPDQTGWERNHNPGLVRDAFGGIPNSTKVSVVVSTGHNSWANENIFTYRLHGWTFDLTK